MFVLETVNSEKMWDMQPFHIHTLAGATDRAVCLCLLVLWGIIRLSLGLVIFTKRSRLRRSFKDPLFKFINEILNQNMWHRNCKSEEKSNMCFLWNHGREIETQPWPIEQTGRVKAVTPVRAVWQASGLAVVEDKMLANCTCWRVFLEHQLYIVTIFFCFFVTVLMSLWT